MSILNRFLCNFAGTIGWDYGNCPINLVEFDWVLQKLLMQSTVTTLWQRRRSVFRWYLSQFSTVLHVILHTPFAAIAATALQIWWDLIEYSKSYQCDALKQHCFHVARALKLRAVIETALRQCPPSYMCDWAVRTDKAGRQDWESNYQHYSDIGPISFFFFFFFKLWYLAENKREKIAFPIYPLLREM